MTLPVILIFVSIALGVISGWYAFASYRRTRAKDLAHKKLVQDAWNEHLDSTVQRLDESLFREQRLKKQLESVLSAHRRATQRVSDEKRDRLFWRRLFLDVAGALAERNKELAEAESHLRLLRELREKAWRAFDDLRKERDIANQEYARLAKKHTPARVSTKGKAVVK